MSNHALSNVPQRRGKKSDLIFSQQQNGHPSFHQYLTNKGSHRTPLITKTQTTTKSKETHQLFSCINHINSNYSNQVKPKKSTEIKERGKFRKDVRHLPC
ncbi:uncharacterized protein A4U43_C07F10320 [Asparagus officinalis]|uniref:Uncharacterized protein n=1 Tax=Asparagus officinalis TaxID=4686 RepID=A0A5P1ECR2_ASPOF|nr:uncharacterized protein A4U43_C07F10320 [Asparagus officinalis]